MLNEFTEKYLELLRKHSCSSERTYGFEYEFLPARPLTVEDLENIFQFLSSMGMKRKGIEFESDQDIQISFEPGGQIEYCSPPLEKHDTAKVQTIIEFIDRISAGIKKELGISYIGAGFIPGRRDAPLCLQSSRYIHLHQRLGRTGWRGHEMMKATASIHLHVRITDLETLLPMFYRLCELSLHDEFKMSPERRNIWDNTDPCRCGMPPCFFVQMKSPEELIERLIDFALHAEVLGEDVIFRQAKDTSFEAFLYHMTTLFTDVRFNLKGPTLELRTPDSIPTDQFIAKWNLFIALFENN